MDRYDHKEVEKKWQERWESEGAFRAEGDPSKEKLYVLDMFPYPSGDGLHVGHVEGYTATDIYSRYMRMQGYDVLHPMGWDAFGLPAENYAIKTGVPPQETTDKSINNFRRQIKRLGLSYDWSRELGTHNPDYYRWTQWLFTKFFEKGLVYKKKALVNWDPVDQTVLANEQVLPDGTAERSGAKVEKKELEQWFFKITDYADELNDALDKVDWPESTKIAQRNWIGRSEGAELQFDISNSDKKVTVFTTRPDTLFGATYVVLAPEHPLVAQLAPKNKEEVEAYIQAARNKSDIDRTAEGKEKTGVELKGIKAINPATKEEIPVFIADYVLGHYGTGAIMAVPAHDERDYEFAQKFSLPIKQVVAPVLTRNTGEDAVRDGAEWKERRAVMCIVKHWEKDEYLCLQWNEFPEIRSFVTGGIEQGEEPIKTGLREIKEETGYTHAKFVKRIGDDKIVEFYHQVKKTNVRARFTYLSFELADGEQVPVKEEEKKIHSIHWKQKEEVFDFVSHLEKDSVWSEFIKGSKPNTKAGILVDSGDFNGLTTEEAKKKITEAVGGTMVKTYRLRDWLISRQRYWGAPIPIVYDPDGRPHAVPEEHLPWTLPTDVEFKPTGTSPLGQSNELLERTEKIFGKGWRPEVDTMDTFVCSSWYFFRFADPHNGEAFASKEAIARWLPVDLYVGGAEHTVLHLLYARFFTKALRDMGYVGFDEPFLKLRHQGIILAEDGRKMSKRWGNVINPDDVAEKFGADTLRLYEMFMGPLEAMKPWNTANIAGVRRFLDRVWRLEPTTDDRQPAAEVETLVHKTIKKIGEDIAALKCNTAISALMILLNECEAKGVSKDGYAIFLRLLAPFAPHIAAELSEQAEVTLDAWPSFDENKIKGDTVEVAVQVNGKVRAKIMLAADASEAEALEAARAAVGKWLTGSEKKAVYIPGRIVSLVI